MFTAFSFGKIIKTILPGSLLAAALLLLVEGIYQLWRPGTGSLLSALPKDWITALTAALIPLSLILGFFLNTFSWMVLNDRMRARRDARLKLTVYSELRQRLSDNLCAESAELHAKLAPALPRISVLDRPSLEFYYLPVVSLTNLNYLWESYFCWYEFDINSACALLLSVPAAAFFLWVKLRAHPGALLFVAIFVLVTLCGVLCWLLSRAAVNNLVSYEKNLLLLIAGSLTGAAKNAEAAPASAAD